MNNLSKLRGKEEPNLHIEDLRFWTQLVPMHLVSNLKTYSRLSQDLIFSSPLHFTAALHFKLEHEGPLKETELLSPAAWSGLKTTMTESTRSPALLWRKLLYFMQ